MPPAIAPGKRPRRQQQRKVVSFAGGQILVKKSGQIDEIFRSDFVDFVQVIYIPLISEDSSSQELLEELWYSREELERMKYDFFYRKKEQRFAERERLSLSPVHSSSKLTGEGQRHNRRYRLQRKTMEVVLGEQEQQRLMCHRIYGKVLDRRRCRSGGIIDPERLREVYVSKGKTLERQEEARARACQNNNENNTCCAEPRQVEARDDLEIITITTIAASTANISTSPHYNMVEINEEDETESQCSLLKRSSSLKCFELSTSCGNCIGCLFHALLTPFLEQKDGPVFLEVGEEMLVAYHSY